MPSRHSLPRRMFLRGLAAGGTLAVGVPVLEAMLDTTGESYADGSPIPTRFGFWFWGNGVMNERWIPSQEGHGFSASEGLQPFADADVLDAVSVATGMALPGSEGNNHHYGFRMACTGSATLVPEHTYVQGLLDPIWDIAADHLAGDTPFNLVEMAVSKRGFQNSRRSGPEYSPLEVFNLLFGQANLEDPQEVERLRLRSRVVDSVWSSTKNLRKRVGEKDKKRLDEHIESLSSIENRLDSLDASCALPTQPGVDPEYDANNEPLVETNELMADMLVTAMACDLTRVFRYFFTGMQTDTVFWQANQVLGHHTMSHDEPKPQNGCHASITFMMSQFAYLLRRMRDTSMGAGTLLDHVSILGTSELGDVGRHSRDDIPILVCGKGGGRLRGGVHYRSNDGANSLRGHFTALRGAGINIDHYGQTGSEPGALHGENLAAYDTIASFES